MRFLVNPHLYLLLILFLFVPETFAQNIASTGSGSEKSDKDFQFMPIPYLNYNRSIGFSIGALPIAMYNLSKKDTISPSSISGAFGMYTTNDTWFTMIFSKFFLKEDRWRIVAAAGLGSINFQVYISNPDLGLIDYNTGANFAKIEVQRKIFRKLYFGLNYTYSKFNTQFDLVIPVEEETTLHGLGAILSLDRRSDVYYPRNGNFTNLKFSTYPEFLSNEYISNKLEIDYNQYFPARNNEDVIAARVYGGFGIGDLSFNQQFIVGNKDIRGYTQGEYRGDQLVAIQGEYRWNPTKKIGIVGFFGLATIFNAINEENNGVILPGIGTGFRYNVFPKNHMNVGLDVAAGKDDWGIYFKVGEAF